MLNNVMLVLAVSVSLSFLVTAQARAQGTPDSQTPAQETVCDGLQGAAFGLCNAYCEAMDCDTDPNASQVACEAVASNFYELTGDTLPCEEVAKPCEYSAHDGIHPVDAVIEASEPNALYCIDSPAGSQPTCRLPAS